MKQPERFPPDDPREWLNRARSNLVRAKNRIPGAYLEDLCFDAQQALDLGYIAQNIIRRRRILYIDRDTIRRRCDDTGTK